MNPFQITFGGMLKTMTTISLLIANTVYFAQSNVAGILATGFLALAFVEFFVPE